MTDNYPPDVGIKIIFIFNFQLLYVQGTCNNNLPLNKCLKVFLLILPVLYINNILRKLIHIFILLCLKITFESVTIMSF